METPHVSIQWASFKKIMYKEEQDMFEGLRFSEINEVREVHYKSKREKEYEEKLIALLDMPLFMDVSDEIAALKEEYKDCL
jgi:hypothetical protein